MKEALIVAGPNGTGKTTFADEYVAAYPRPFLSADATAQRLHPERPEAAQFQAGRTFFNELDTLIQRGEDFVVESTLAGLGFIRILRRLKQAGYTVTIAFLFLDTPASCVVRVEERVRKGGHDVPEADIVRRYYRSKHNFWNVHRHIAGAWQLFYNAVEGFQLTATGEGTAYRVSDELLFELFINDLNDEAARCKPLISTKRHTSKRLNSNASATGRCGRRRRKAAASACPTCIPSTARYTTNARTAR